MSVTNERELAGLIRCGAVVAGAVRAMAAALRPGVTTAELDAIGERFLASRGAIPAPRATYGFPGATCISVNAEVAHGIPGPRVLRDGDLVNLDVSANLDGYYTDTGASFPVGRADPEALVLCEAGRAALDAGLVATRTGARFSAIGKAIAAVVEGRGCNVIRDLTGHGVGRALHEEPSDVRSFYEPRDRRRVSEGLVFTLEPMVSRTARTVVAQGDGWTYLTCDGSRVVQFEHTVVATRRGAIVVTNPDRVAA